MKYYYHITPSRNIPSIMLHGLSVTRRHKGLGLLSDTEHFESGGIYLANDIEDVMRLSEQNFVNKRYWGILQVQISSNTQVFPDSRARGAIKILDSIPPSNLKLVGYYDSIAKKQLAQLPSLRRTSPNNQSRQANKIRQLQIREALQMYRRTHNA